jgi:hypothetical protein
MHTCYASIAVDANGNMALGFAGPSATTYASAYYTGRLATDSPGTVRPTSFLAAGLGSYVRAFSDTRNRWGDYSGISVDPTDDSTFWVFNEYALIPATSSSAFFMGEKQLGLWGTRWRVFSFSNPAPTVVAFRVGSTGWTTAFKQEADSTSRDTAISRQPAPSS